MKELVNSFDKEVSFTNLEDAKKYYYPSAEDDNQTKSSEDFLGEPSKFPEYLKQWDEYKNAIKSIRIIKSHFIVALFVFVSKMYTSCIAVRMLLR